MKITETLLKQHAGQQSFARGKAYFDQQRVSGLTEYQKIISATVRGNEPYHVKLWFKGKQLKYSCSCPVGSDGDFCKHGVAVGLAYRHQLDTKALASSSAAVEISDLPVFLATQEPSFLIQLIMEQVVDNEHLANRLLLKAEKSRATGKKLDLKSYLKKFNQATETAGFVDYYQSNEYAQGISVLIDSFQELLTEGFAVEVVTLTEHAIVRLDEKLLEIDDSSGVVGGLLRGLEALHLEACLLAKPDGVRLAEWIFQAQMEGHFDVLSDAAEHYKEVLQEAGLRRYQALAEAAWSEVSPLMPGDKEEFTQGRYTLTRIMESFARASDDLEVLIAIKSRDLSSGYRYLEIAKLYQNAEQVNRAIEWAERGVEAFKQDPDARLRDFLAEMYHHEGRDHDAVQQMWQKFAERTGLEEYQSLKHYAEYCGDWPSWRDKALQLARSPIEGHQNHRHPAWGRKNSSLLVRIFLWEKEVDAAWQEAKVGGCHPDVWLTLAVAREQDHPEDAIPIYQRQVEALVDRRQNESYQEAGKYVKKVERLFLRLNQHQAFQQYLSSLKVQHKPKRNFMQVLAGHGW